MVRRSLFLLTLAAIVVTVGCGEPVPSVEGYTQLSEAEARQFAEECAGLIAKGRVSEVCDYYDSLYFLHHYPEATQVSSKAEYEDFNKTQKEFWLAQLGVLSSANSCNVKSIEEREQGRRVTLESTGKLAGQVVPVVVDLDLIKSPDGQIVIYNLSQGLGKR